MKFFQRHKSKLVILAACISFLTFVVKEVLQDQVKELGTALDRASSNHDLMDGLGRIQMMLELTKAEEVRETNADYARLDKACHQILESRNKFLEGSLERTSAVIVALPNADDALEEQERYLTAELKAEEAMAILPGIDAQLSEITLKHKVEENIAALDKEITSSGELLEKLRSFYDDVKEKADEQKESVESFAHLLTYTCYGFFIISWMVGVLLKSSGESE